MAIYDQIAAINPDFMNNFNTKYSVKISKNSPILTNDNFLNILESEQMTSMINNASGES